VTYGAFCFRESDAIIWQSSSHLPAKVDDFDKHNIVESASLSPILNKLEKNVPLRKKIISESTAPWRTCRLFMCATLGSGAALGGLITLAGLMANLSGARSDTRSLST
jgi:hypothetical protein